MEIIGAFVVGVAFAAFVVWAKKRKDEKNKV